ncbi:MAG: hypothetical protein J4N26_05320 [Chloroflexi bacterium]|nr:hypothetical protein [Chloroflexota bacterium]
MTARLSRDDDEEAILRVLAAAFERWPAADLLVPPIDHLRWKLRSHERALHFVGVIDGRVAATRLHVVQRIKVGERILLSQYGVDNAVLPQYQGLGLMAALRDFGWDHLGTYDMAYFVESDHPRMLALAPKVPVPLERIGNPVEVLSHDGSGLPPGRGSRSWQIESAQRFDERTDAFWHEASRPFDFIVVRDEKFLNHRFDRRGGTFEIRLATEDGRMLGYLVMSRTSKRRYIADLLVLPGRLDVLEALVRDALVGFRATSAKSVRCWLPRHHPYRDVLERLGFRPRKHEVAFAFEPYRATSDELRFLHNPRLAIHASISDSDLV